MKYVYSFGAGKAEGDGAMKDVLGGKGAGLAEMTRIGLPVPAGVTISAQCCDYYLKHGRTYPKELRGEVAASLARLEKITGKKLGDSRDPLLVSVRSGSARSMPGMMETMRGTGITYGRELTAPQTAISVGAGWALVGWGLYRLRNWARWCAMALMVIGVAGSVPAVSSAARDITWHFFFYGTQIMVRIVIAWYLAASPEVLDAFRAKSDTKL